MTGLRNRLFRLYWWLEARIAPGNESSQYKYERSLARWVTPTTRWLDLGCGRSIFPTWVGAPREHETVKRARAVVGIDYDLDSLRDNRSIRYRVRGEAARFPFRDESFDLVSANMVVEHLDDPTAEFREVRRVLTPGGVFLFHTPSSWGSPTLAARCLPGSAKHWLIRILQDREEKDVFPTHYLANSRHSISGHAAVAGLSIIELRFVTTSAAFALIPPLAVIELCWISLLRWRPLARFRADIIVVLRRS